MASLKVVRVLRWIVERASGLVVGCRVMAVTETFGVCCKAFLLMASCRRCVEVFGIEKHTHGVSAV